MKAPYLPDVASNNHLNNTKNKYLDKLSQLKILFFIFHKKIKTSVLSSYVEDKNEEYDPNWADEF